MVMLVVPLSTASWEVIKMTNFKMAESKTDDDSQAIVQDYRSMGVFVEGNVFTWPKVRSSLLAMKCYGHAQCELQFFFPPADSDCLFAKERWPHLVAALNNFIKKI